MPLTAAHQEAPILSQEKLRKTAEKDTFGEIMRLPLFERAEVLEYLTRIGATVKLRSTAPEDITFTVQDPHYRHNRHVDEPITYQHTIPGSRHEPAGFPLYVAVYVHSSLDQPQFGGETFAGGDLDDNDRFRQVRRVPARPNLITFHLVRPPHLTRPTS